MKSKPPLTIVSFIAVLSNGTTITIGKDHTSMSTQHFGSAVCKTEDFLKEVEKIQQGKS
jgi:hypothetical protein